MGQSLTQLLISSVLGERAKVAAGRRPTPPPRRRKLRQLTLKPASRRRPMSRRGAQLTSIWVTAWTTGGGSSIAAVTRVLPSARSARSLLPQTMASATATRMLIAAGSIPKRRNALSSSYSFQPPSSGRFGDRSFPSAPAEPSRACALRASFYACRASQAHRDGPLTAFAQPTPT